MGGNGASSKKNKGGGGGAGSKFSSAEQKRYDSLVKSGVPRSTARNQVLNARDKQGTRERNADIARTQKRVANRNRTQRERDRRTISRNMTGR